MMRHAQFVQRLFDSEPQPRDLGLGGFQPPLFVPTLMRYGFHLVVQLCAQCVPFRLQLLHPSLGGVGAILPQLGILYDRG